MEQEITNQHLIARPCHVDVHSAGSQCELPLQLVNQLIGAAQSQHFNQQRNLGKDWQRRIRSSRIIWNQILGKSILSIPNDQRTTKNELPSAHQLTLTKRVSLKVQYPSTRCFQSQLLVTSKMFDTLEVSQDFMWAVGQHQNVLAADATVKVARFASCICSSSDEETKDFICPSHFLHFKCAF